MFAEFGGGTWNGVRDQSSSFSLGWTPGALYLAVRVVDDVHQNAGVRRQNAGSAPPWMAVAGACVVDGGCFSSHDDAGSSNYPSNTDCTFTTPVAGVLRVETFSVEADGDACGSDWDHLTIGGTRYCGSNAPDGVAVGEGESFVWKADGGAEATGFRICVATEIDFRATVDAAAAAIAGPDLKTDWAGYSGAGFVLFNAGAPNLAGQTITFTVDVPSPGTYTAAVRYSLNTNDRPLELSVNGAVVAAVAHQLGFDADNKNCGKLARIIGRLFFTF